MNAVLDNQFVRDRIHSVVFDYEGPTTDKLTELQVDHEIYPERNADAFCDRLLDYCTANGVDYVLSYYTQFYSKRFRDTFRDRIINFHPSLLPAFKGMDGFGDNVRYYARFAGNTVEFIDEVMDEGKIIMQTACPIDLTKPISSTRHVVFLQQCKALIQTVKWLCEDRISVHGREVTISNARYSSCGFSPDLDCSDARDFMVAEPKVPLGTS